MRWGSKHIRQTFIDFFNKQHDHVIIPSSSIIPKKSDGTYFVNAGMNQFKSIFLGHPATHRRVVNSQKCVRIGGKHNDLDDVGSDLCHHTFFEMLGSWSFGDYFKKEACAMAWELLTSVYRIPPSRLYVTYFGGDQQLRLQPDHQSRDIWRDIGVKDDHLLPCGMADNFWDMGDTGPCGPCTEIHYDHTNVAPDQAIKLVNSGSNLVTELWNLVFMQYNRESNGALNALPEQHVDTGMGLERLTALLQNKKSNYDTDLFLPIIKHIEKYSRAAGYKGQCGSATDTSHQAGLDRAYRVISDHVRTITICLAEGLLPGNDDLQQKLRMLMHRAFNAASDLKSPPGLLSNLIPSVIESLGEAYPELQHHPQHFQDIVNAAEENYRQKITNGRHCFQRALQKYGSVKRLTGDQVWEIHVGRFGDSVSLDLIADLATELHIQVDEEAVIVKMTEKKERDAQGRIYTEKTVIPSSIELILKHTGVPITDDSYKYLYQSENGVYEISSIRSNVLQLVKDNSLCESVEGGERCDVILDKTQFYSEAGGQVSDKGTIKTGTGVIEVEDVQTVAGYVVHRCFVSSGVIRVGDLCTLHINQDYRFGCMCNHTATHVLNYCLNEVLGDVKQQGSKITPTKLSFDFTCLGNLTLKALQKIEDIVADIIKNGQKVLRREMMYSDAITLSHVRYLNNEMYPSTVYVVSFEHNASGDRSEVTSVELCGGTHVHNTRDIQDLVITSVSGAQAATKNLTAVTGLTAKQAMINATRVKDQIVQLESDIGNDEVVSDKLLNLETNIERCFTDLVLPKVKREQLKTRFDKVKVKIHQKRNKDEKNDLYQKVKNILDTTNGPFVLDFMQFRVKEIVQVLDSIPDKKPIILFNVEKKIGTCICYVPQDYQLHGLVADKWLNSMACKVRNSQCFSSRYNSDTKTVFLMTGSLDIDTVDQCRTVAQLHFQQWASTQHTMTNT